VNGPSCPRRTDGPQDDELASKTTSDELLTGRAKDSLVMMNGTMCSCWQLQKLPDADAILIGQQTSFTTQAAGITLFRILPPLPRTSSSDVE